jgi:hypothetical protein
MVSFMNTWLRTLGRHGTGAGQQAGQTAVPARFCGSALIIPLLSLTACSSPQSVQSPVPQASQSALPAYVYPSDPPVVGAEELRGLVVRLDARRTLIWVFNDSPGCSSVAALLADRRDELRAEGIALAGLFTGPPTDWQGRAVPLLRGAEANFPCGVMDPGRRPSLGVWLADHPDGPPPGLYVLGPNRRVQLRAAEDEAAIRECLDGLMGDGRITSRPAGGPIPTQTSSAAEVFLAEVRLIEIASGQTLARAEARAEELDALAQLLAEQLAAAVPHPPFVAILAMRQSSRDEEKSPERGLTLSQGVGRHLTAAGWHRLVQAHEAGQVLASLDQTPLSVEFNPASLQGQIPWQAILLGAVSAEKASRQP